MVVDAANVVGSRPDGWWRDRAGAARRLATEIVAALAAGAFGDATVHLVVEGAAARAADLPEHPDLVVVRAPADGDATIAALAAELGEAAQVVTADRALRERVHAAGATTIGPATFLAALR